MARTERPELGYLTSTLKGAAAVMGERDRQTAHACFDHWRRECARIGGETSGEPERVAFTLHEVIDERMQQMRAVSPHAREVKCSKGCAACCSLHVGIYPHEAALLLMVARETGIDIDYARLARQATKDDATWRELAPEDQRCVFLADDQTCRVYEHRPGACRKYLVKSDPDLCDMHKHPGGKVGIVFSIEAEIVQSAAMTVYGVGNMAQMLLKGSSKT